MESHLKYSGEKSKVQKNLCFYVFFKREGDGNIYVSVCSKHFWNDIPENGKNSCFWGRKMGKPGIMAGRKSHFTPTV